MENINVGDKQIGDKFYQPQKRKTDDFQNYWKLIIGSPNYLSNVTASFRALYERLIFQNLTYNLENPCCKERTPEWVRKSITAVQRDDIRIVV